MWMKDSSLILVLVLSFQGVSSQLLVGCPVNWNSFQDNCYKFVSYPRLTFDEAVIACSAEGAGLVSINDIQENNFIDQELQQIDPQRSLWWTSGIHLDNKVKWLGDGTFAMEEYWASPAERLRVPINVAFRYSSIQYRYGWGKYDASEVAKYICELPSTETSRIVQENRDFTYGTNISDPSFARRGPKFQIQPIDSVVVMYSYLPNLECLAEGNPQPTLEWHRRLESGVSEVIQSSSRYTISNGKLTFDQLNETNDAGVYHCVASNQVGSVRSEPARLTFGSLEQFPNVRPGVVNVAQYQGTYLNCNPPAHKPALRYQWRKGHEYLQPTLNSYFFLSENGNLYFSEVQQSDYGNYRCIVTLAALPGEILETTQPPSKSSLEIYLDVHGETASDFPPNIHDDFPQVFPGSPIRGQTITIECLAYGRLPLKYSWRRVGGKSLPSGHSIRDFGRVLVIPDVDYNDEGTYTCTVNGPRQVDRKDFLLTIGAKPYFIYPLKDMIADEGSEITWRCPIMAKPRATVSWYKNAQLLQSIPGEMEISSNVLKIKNLNNGHNGMYQCSATNIHGTTVGSAQLNVMSFPPTFSKNPLQTTMMAARNGNLTIPCRPEAAPVAEITWTRNGAGLSPQHTDGNQKGLQQLNNGYLKIVGVSYSDGGFYTCHAKNKNGEAQSTTNVDIATGVAIATRPSTTFVVKNHTAFMECDATYDRSVYDLVYVWMLNGRLIDPKKDPIYEVGAMGTTRGLFIKSADYKHAGEYTCIAKTPITQASASALLTVRGPPGEPGYVYALKGSITANSITLKWTAPPSHGSMILYYVIQGRTELNNTWVILAQDIPDRVIQVADVSQSHKRQYILQGLIPYNKYQFRVYAINGYGVGDISYPSESYTIPGSKPVKPPQNVGGGQGSVGVLTIKWQLLPPQDRCGPGVGYNVYWRRAGSQNTLEKVKINETNYLLQRNLQKVPNGYIAQYTESIGVDYYYLPYEVIVGVYNDFGEGPNSTIKIVYSSEGIPLARPTGVSGYEINSTALYITWNPMNNTREAMKGVIQGFEINVDDFNDPNRKSVTAYHYVAPNQTMTGGSVIGLEPNSDYWVTVQVFNSAGESNPSERQRVSTCLSAPVLYPEFVIISSHGPNSVYVSWRGVSTGIFEEVLKGYKMRWWKQGDNIRSANDTVVGKETHGVIYGIQKNYVYQLRVLGYSKGGDGKMSPTKYFTLSGGIVRVDRTISAIRASGHHNLPSWTLLLTAFILRIFTVH